MKILIAPDSFKGCINALEAAKAIAEGIRRVFSEAQLILAPMADGGEGTVEALAMATNGRFITTEVRGPLGAPVQAVWGILGDGKTAVIEMAAASGLPLLAPELHGGGDVRDPLRASTFGTGQLMKAALDAGVKKIVMGIGGSATNDGGSGCISALGARFLDATGQELPPGGAALARLTSIDLSGLDARLREVEVLVACDVDNPLCGPQGASAVYGPQKGATPTMVAELDAALAHYAAICQTATNKNMGKDFGKNAANPIMTRAGAGAAGGLGAGLMFFTKAQLRSGAQLVMETMHLKELLHGVDLVFTGEGGTNFQTAFGKAPSAVAKLAKEVGREAGKDIPVVCVSGSLSEGANEVYAHGIDALMSATPAPMPLESCLLAGREFLADATERACRLIRIGTTFLRSQQS